MIHIIDTLCIIIAAILLACALATPLGISSLSGQLPAALVAAGPFL